MQDILGCDKNSSNCHITVIDVGWYSQKHWNRSSWKAGHSRMIWALSSLASWHRRHCGSTAGSTFDLWYFRKLWPVRCLMHNPRSFRLKRTSSLESLGFGSGKNIFVCLQWPELSHLDFHFSMVSFRAKDLISQCGRGRKGPGPSTSESDAALASLSASSFPWCPWCPCIHRMHTCLSRLSLFNALTALNTVCDLTKCPDTAWIADWQSLNIVMESYSSLVA